MMSRKMDCMKGDYIGTKGNRECFSSHFTLLVVIASIDNNKSNVYRCLCYYCYNINGVQQ